MDFQFFINNYIPVLKEEGEPDPDPTPDPDPPPPFQK